MPAPAAVLLAADSPLEVEWGGTVVHDSDGDLFAVDMKGGTPIELLGTTADTMSDMAFSPSGELFGLGGWPLGPSQLYTVEIDFDNPGGYLRTDWIATVHEPGFSNLLLNGLEFGPDGLLYGVGYGWETNGIFNWPADDNLYLIDTTTGVAQPLLSLDSHHAAGDLTFDEDGTGYTVTDNGILLAIENDFSGYTAVNTDFSIDWGYYGLTYGAGPQMFAFREGHDAYRINPDDATETYLGTMYHQRLNSVNGAASVYRPPTVLEDMDFLELDDQTPILGELWYRIEAAHDGILTADLPGLDSARDVDMVLYSRDSAGTLNVLGSGEDRVDYADAQADGLYYLQVTGVEAGVDVRLTNLVSPTATGVNVFDTQGSDRFECYAGSSYVVTINGVSYQPNTSGVETVEVTFTGTAGLDTARLTGTNGNDTAALDARTGSGSLSSPGFRVDVDSVAEIHVDGGGGNDSATMVGTDGIDEATMQLRQAALKSPGRLLDVANVDVIQIDAGAGDDTSTLTGSIWAEKVYLYPDSGLYYAYFEPGAPTTGVHDFRINTSGIETNTVTGRGFDDEAFLHGSEFNDEYTSHPGEATFAGPGYSQTILGYPAVHAYGERDGHDVARIYDSTANEKLKGAPTFTLLRGGGFFSRAKFFDEVYAYSTVGGNDYAVFNDSDGDDTFDFSPTEATLEGDGFSILAEQFERVLARAGGGYDIARLTDSPGANTFRGRSHKAMLYGDGLDLTARRFDEVYAQATPGGGDVAKLHDTPGNDHLEAAGNWARMSIDSGALDMLYEVAGFDDVHAYHTEGADTTDITTPLLYDLDPRGGW